MALTPQELEKIASLAHLALTAEERTRLTSDLNAIVGLVDRIAATEEAPLAVPIPEPTAVLQPDSIQSSLPTEEALSSAPAHSATAVLAKPLEPSGA